jgi:clan AA aspartic protease
MGHVFQKITLSAESQRDVSMLVDTGATYSLISPDLADQLGVSRFPRKETVTLANGHKIEADIGLVRVQVGDRAVATPAIIADCDEPLLGVEALEALGLSVDPTTGELKPTRGYAVRLGGLLTSEQSRK